MEKEQFINEILNSTNGITKVNLYTDLFLKIEQKIAAKNVISMKAVLLVAASIVLLISLNITLLDNLSKENQSELANLERVINNNNNQLYK